MKAVNIGGTVYKVGDRLFYENRFGQQFYADIVGVYKDVSGRASLVVVRDDQPGDICLNPLDYVRTRHFPKEQA